MNLEGEQARVAPIFVILSLFFLFGLSGLLYSWFNPKVSPESPLEVPVFAGEVTGNQGQLADFGLNRDRQRSRLLEKMETMLAAVDREKREKLQEEILLLLQYSVLENEVEQLLAIKGYPLNAVALYPEAVTVIIKGQDLDLNSVAELGELVSSVTGYPREQIRILE